MLKNVLSIIIIDLLWPSDIWWHTSVSILVRIEACCLTASSHSLNKCWLIIKDIFMGKCKKDVAPLLTHWSYVFLALTHQFVAFIWEQFHKQQEVLMILNRNMCLEIMLLKLLPHLHVTNELTHLHLDQMAAFLQTIFSDAFLWIGAEPLSEPMQTHFTDAYMRH